MTRVAVFIDYENIRHGARSAFGNPRRDSRSFGHVVPLRLGLLLTQLGQSVDADRRLTVVNVYRGRPGPKSGPKAQASAARQFAAWESQSRVRVRSRQLRYQPIAWSLGRPSEWRAEEKGIDVMMALDIALGARDDTYDVAIVVSADSDLEPAVELALEAGKRVETAMWWSHDRRNHRLTIPGIRLWNHALRVGHFRQVRDDTDYSRPT